MRLRRNLATRRSEIAHDQVQAQTCMRDAALSSARPAVCALDGASLFLVWTRRSNQKEGHPCIRVLLRKTPLTPALLRVSSRRDIHADGGPDPSLLARHPCLASPHATSTLGLLKGTWARVVCKLLNCKDHEALRSFVSKKTIGRHRTPLSGGRMESLRRGASGMDAARAVKGHGWPLRGDPRSSDGMREVERSETRMQGQDLLVPFGATAKRDSPSRAKPMPQPTSPIGYTPRILGQKASQARTLRLPRGYKSTLQTLRSDSHPVAPRRDTNEENSLVCA